MTDPRDRYNGSIDDMAKAFKPVAAKEPGGEKMLAYPTAGTVKLSVLNKVKLKASRTWLRAGKSLHSSMSFKKKEVKGAFRSTFKQNYKRWKMNIKDESKFAEKCRFDLGRCATSTSVAFVMKRCGRRRS